MIFICIGAPYWLTYAEGLCLDEDTYPVTDKYECRVAMPFLKVQYPSAIDNINYSYNWTTRPNGCFLHLPNNEVHWNPVNGNRNKDDRQVCKNHGK